MKRRIGFTNCMAIYIIILLSFGMLGGFILAFDSIRYDYMGALACYTVGFTPMSTALSLVLGKVVKKNEMENTSSEGEGIQYASAKASNFLQDSPPI